MSTLSITFKGEISLLTSSLQSSIQKSMSTDSAYGHRMRMREIERELRLLLKRAILDGLVLSSSNTDCETESISLGPLLENAGSIKINVKTELLP